MQWRRRDEAARLNRGGAGRARPILDCRKDRARRSRNPARSVQGRGGDAASADKPLERTAATRQNIPCEVLRSRYSISRAPASLDASLKGVTGLRPANTARVVSSNRQPWHLQKVVRLRPSCAARCGGGNVRTLEKMKGWMGQGDHQSASRTGAKVGASYQLSSSSSTSADHRSSIARRALASAKW